MLLSIRKTDAYLRKPMMINSNKTEEDRVSKKITFLLPGGILTFFLGFFMLKNLGVKDMTPFFTGCYLFFFCGIILMLAHYRRTGWVPAVCAAAAALLMIIYRDRVLTINIAVPLVSLFVFFILSKLLERIGFAVFMLINDIFWCVNGTDNKLLVGLLVVGSIYALGRLVRKNADVFIMPVMILMLAALLPVGKGPIKWTLAENFINKIAKVSEFDKEEFNRRNKKPEEIMFTGYSGTGELQGALSTKYRKEINFKRDSGGGSIYLEGSHFATIIPKGQMHKEVQEVTYFDWAFYLINGLMSAGITPEEASSFIRLESAEIEYIFLKTEDIICPGNVIGIEVILNVESEGKKTGGFKYRVEYLVIDRTSPVYEKLLHAAEDAKGNEIYPQEKAQDYFYKLYQLLSIEAGGESDGDADKKSTESQDDEGENTTVSIDVDDVTVKVGDHSGLGTLFDPFRYFMLEERTEYWDEYIDAVNSGKPLPDKQKYDIAYLFSGEYDIDSYLDTSMATERMEELVKSITDGLGSAYDKAVAIEAYLRSHCKYNKKTDLRGYDNFVDAFLFEVKKGYCVHYASAMAVMLRIAGVPSRYVSGYHFNYRTTAVMSSDAHAWVEAYISGIGWVPFEPTGVSVEMNQSSYEPDDIISDDDVLITTTEEIVDNKKKTTEFAAVLRLILRYLVIIIAAAALFVLITLAVKKIIFRHLPPARKLQEIVKIQLRNIEKRIDNADEIKELRLNNSSLYNYLNYTVGKYEKEDLKELLDVYYRVRFRGDEITEDDIRRILSKTK